MMIIIINNNNNNKRRRKFIDHDLVVFIPGMQVCLRQENQLMQSIYTLKDRNNKIILIKGKNTIDKVQQLFFIEVLKNQGTKESNLNIIMATKKKKKTLHHYYNEHRKLKTFLLNQKKSKCVHFHCCYSIQHLRYQREEIQEKRMRRVQVERKKLFGGATLFLVIFLLL